MAYRDQWKMLHVLNTSKKGILQESELIELGIDCYPDTIQYLLSDGLVTRDVNGNYALHPLVFRMLNRFLVAMGAADMKEVFVDTPSCFVVMPFSASWSDLVFKNLIQAALNAASIECIRGDMIPRVGKLSENIVKQIQTTGLVLADISVPNANVFYELGIADTIGRDVILLYEANAKQSIPADIQGAHYFAYDINNLALSAQKLTDNLLKWKADNKVDITLQYCRK